ncbi:YlxR family protein [Cyanobacteria bacterium FACHB-DQ100]|nr:YlxR family protein [Cyanobacteria bacterium FACHB-DQ100]
MPLNYRRCLSCRKVAPKEEFLRVVRLYPSHEIAINTGMGRSAYLCPSPSCIQAAQKKGRLSRALKATVPTELYQHLQQKQVEVHATQPELY